MSDFITGLHVKPPHPNAPDYVKCKLGLHRDELIAYLQSQTGEWINADVKVSRDGKWYAAIDDWKPNGDDAPAARSAPAPRAKAADADADGFVDKIPF